MALSTLLWVMSLVGVMSLHAAQGMTCNGMEGLCDLKFNQVTLPGTHNSGANRIMKYNGLIMFPASSCWYRNQDYTFTQQLDFGIRFFDIDTCYLGNKGDKIWTCHNTANGEPLKGVIKEIADWLNNPIHRNEVVSMRFHDTRVENGINDFDPLFNDYLSGANGKVGMNTVVNGQWQNYPTLRDAIDQNKRVFIFMTYKLCDANCRSSRPYIRSADAYFDTWQSRSLTSSCSGMVGETRQKCVGKTGNQLIMVSAFATKGLCVSDLQLKCNPYIGESTMACYDEIKNAGKTVNFVTADFVNRAKTTENVVTVANEMNEKNIQKFG